MTEGVTFQEFLALAWPVFLRWLPVYLAGVLATAYFIRWLDWGTDKRALGSAFWPILWFTEALRVIFRRPFWHIVDRWPDWLEALDRRVSVYLSTKVQEDDYGELLRGPLPHGGVVTWVRVKDETGSHVIRADPASETAHQAVAASFGMTAETYDPTAQS